MNSPLLAGALVFMVFVAACSAQLLVSRMAPRRIAILALTLCVSGAVVLVVAVVSGWIVGVFVSALLSGAAQGLGQLTGLSALRRITPLDGLRSAYMRINTVGYAVAGGTILALAPVISALGIPSAIAVVGIGVALLSIVSAITLRRSSASLSTALPSRRTALLVPDDKVVVETGG